MKYTSYPDCTPSFAEKIVIDKLRSFNVYFDREVSFDGLVNPATNQPLRFDFYIPTYNMIIEYDGIESHSSHEVKVRDGIKNEFAKNNRIKLVRISGIKMIDAFFDSNAWKKCEKKAVIHKSRTNIPKPKNIAYVDLAPEQKAVRSQAEIKEILRRRQEMNMTPDEKQVAQNQAYLAARFAAKKRVINQKKRDGVAFTKELQKQLAKQRFAA